MQAVDDGRKTRQNTPGPSYGSGAYMAYVLLMLLLVYTLYAVHRSILLVLVEPIKNELHLTDGQMGFVAGPAFSVFFAISGVPLGLLADRSNRRNLVAFFLGMWSIATGLCGAVQGIVQMAVGRAAVGVGISGGLPACMAIISDIFPANWRATAMSVFYLGGSFGVVAAFGGGSWFAAHYGWRSTLWMAAVPGLAVAALLYFTVREPLRGLSDGKHQSTGKTSVGETLKFIARQRSVVQIVLGLIFLHMIGNGLMAFVASFLIRSHGMSLSEAGGTISLLNFLTTPFSQIAAGFIADFLGRFDDRWRLRLGPIGSIFCMLAIFLMTLSGSKVMVFAGFAAWALGSGLYQAPLYALLQNLVKPHMRATMGSIQFVLTSAIGGAMGPLFVGLVSDSLGPRYGVDSMRYALFIVSLFYLWATVHFVLGERHLRSDLANAEQT